jgi:hypothetical protein
MSLLTLREVILAKVETTYGTDPTPSPSTDAVMIEGPSWSFEGLRMHERPAVRASVGKLQQVFGGTLKTVSFDVEVKGSGAAGTAPEIGQLLRGCGLDETIVPSTSVTYAPVSTGYESLTIYYYQDGVRHILTGCRGNVSFSGEAGGIVKASFKFTGHSVAAADVAIVSPSYDSTVPPVFLNASFSIDSFAAVIGSLNFDLSNTIAMPPDVSATDGYSEIMITGRDVNGSFSPEYTLVASEDWEGNFRSGAAMALASGSIGGTAGNILGITMPAVY